MMEPQSQTQFDFSQVQAGKWILDTWREARLITCSQPELSVHYISLYDPIYDYPLVHDL